MNRTLLLIICDFLLLNFLALTHWEKVELAPKSNSPVAPSTAGTDRGPRSDLATAMKLALEDERATRERMQQRLEFAESDVKTRERLLGQMQGQKAQLETGLAQTRQNLQELSQRYSASTQEIADSRQRLSLLQQTNSAQQAEAQRQQQALSAAIRSAEAEKAQLSEQMARAVAARDAEVQRQQQAVAELERQKIGLVTQSSNLATAVKVAQAEKDLLREQMERQLQQALAAKQAELLKQQQALAESERQRAAAAAQAASLGTAVKVAEAERNLLREGMTELKQEVAVVRQEKELLRAQTARLSDGVGQLAVKSGELAREIRENTPVNMNLVFNDFFSNRVTVAITARAPVIFGSGLRQKETTTVLVHDRGTVYAVIHVSETPFSLAPPAGMDQVEATVTRGATKFRSGPLTFITADPRIAVIAVDPAAAPGVRVYPLAANPFKFTDAVLISRGGKNYGEVEFSMDPKMPGFVRMKSRILNRLLGEFSASAGDLVLSKTGEFLGLMVNSEYCAVPRRLEPAEGFVLENQLSTDGVRSRLEELRARLDRLPSALR